MSIGNAREFHTHQGIKGWVVSPSAWIFHKGLTFTKRKTLAKVCKDLYGIWYAASQLGDCSRDSRTSLKLLMKNNPSWTKKFVKLTTKWIENASPSDWMSLEAQDPSGRLKKLPFKQLIKSLYPES